ncbi:MAG: ABC transporter ATP-binding protein/permease [Oscillospiraceae bacterium]|nr:ABC transporter ATP-binding protein/permease [Oscillospiraceae bacterium]
MTKLSTTIKQGIRISLSIVWKSSKAVALVYVLAVIMRVALPFLGILMPKVVLDQVVAQSTPQRFFIIVGGFSLLLVAVNYLKSFSDRTVDSTTGIVVLNENLILNNHKVLTMDYEQMDSPEFKQISSKADKAMYSNHSPVVNIPKFMVELLTNCFGFLLYAITISLVNPLILVVLLITAGINWLMLSRSRRYMEATRDRRSKQTKRLDALKSAMLKPESAKDIRLYGAIGWLRGLYRKEYGVYRKDERKVFSKDMHAQIVDALMILLRDGAAYAFLLWLVLGGRMSLGDFVLTFAAIGALAGWVSGILTAASDVSKASIEYSDLREKLAYPDKMNTGDGIPIPSPCLASNEYPPSIELCNLSYTYPNAETPALKDINIHINSGERIAIVGANGAGKTTLIKLLCGLYLPTEGEVRLNGNPIIEYNRDEYYSLFAAVFQDIYFLATSISENISQRTMELTDKEKVNHCLKLSGLISKTDALPDKEKTKLVRAVHPDAIELSGGEQQKLAMARALYKDAPILILDEPTAALDPLAENEVYQKYAELTESKTSVFISHRLASTRFCDRILLLDGNMVAEQGSHDELMALGGIYANMFNVQASYYQEEVSPA